MKLKLISMAGAALLALSGLGFAGDIYRINNYNSLITASHDDLAIFMGLNARHMKTAVRNMYARLDAEGALFNLQPGTRVNVVMYYGDGIARIEWGNGRYAGYIAKDDLGAYLGSTDNPSPFSVTSD